MKMKTRSNRLSHHFRRIVNFSHLLLGERIVLTVNFGISLWRMIMMRRRKVNTRVDVLV